MGVLLKVRKVGGSMMTTIPSDEVKKWNLTNGDVLEAELKPVRKDMFGALRGKKIVFTHEDRWSERE